MTKHGEDRFLKAVLAIRDGLAEVVERLNDVLKDYAPAEIKFEKIAELFPEDLRNLLSFEEQADAIIIRSRQYLGSENFAKIAAVVREASGEYISQGKQSHFRIPRKAVK
jgi:hypothetical protein